MTRPNRSNWKAWRFLLLTAGPIVLVAVSTVVISVYVAGLHSNRITLNDPSASSVAVATDVDAYRVLLWVRPMPAWEGYLRGHLTTEEYRYLRPVLRRDVQQLRELQTAGRILELPNGTRAEQMDQIVLTPPDNPLHRTALEAMRIRVRTGPHRGLEAWTPPDLFQHDGAPPIP